MQKSCCFFFTQFLKSPGYFLKRISKTGNRFIVRCPIHKIKKCHNVIVSQENRAPTPGFKKRFLLVILVTKIQDSIYYYSEYSYKILYVFQSSSPEKSLKKYISSRQNIQTVLKKSSSVTKNIKNIIRYRRFKTADSTLLRDGTQKLDAAPGRFSF